MGAERKTRADARRNRLKIMETARAQIAQHGPAVSMSQLARAAGVAVGTLYRHFPTKTDLVAAVVNEHIERLVEAAEQAWARVQCGRGDPGQEVLRLVRLMMEASVSDHAVKAAAHALGAELSYDEAEARAAGPLTGLIAAGREAGVLRPDLEVSDIYLLAATVPSDQPAAVRERWLALIQSGLLRAPVPSPLPAPS
ncbi:MAG: TetR/AcrR family transcriptional regulator [Propionibacteriaceae bacterium]|jgi:AcrR family transcriptional regulator|nr:TetR/AcrR family transcriptional regulator [Propionibacteriaceae bacterium]